MNKSLKSEQVTKRQFLEKIARMYYILEMSQKDIADNLRIGRSSVARFLKEAKEEGIIRFLVTSSTEKEPREIALEKEIVNKFKLTDALIIPNDNESMFEQTIVSYLHSILPLNGVVGVGGGNTMNYLSTVMNISDKKPDLNIVQTIGGFSNNEKKMPSTSTIQNWAVSLGANALFLPAPAIVDNQEIKDVYFTSKSMNDVYKQIKQMDMLISGIGSLKDVEILEELGVENINIDLIQKECVGDINLHFFDKNGNFSMPDLSKRIIGISRDDFKSIPIKVSVAFGEEKVNAIEGALNGKLTDILITTSDTAEKILEK